MNSSRKAAAEALRDVGVGEPKLSELAQLPGITPAIVRDLTSRPGKGPGALVNDLPAAIATDRRHRGQRKKELAKDRKRKETEEAIRTDLQTRREGLQDLRAALRG